MRYRKVFLESIGYELAPHVVTSEDIEDRLAPLYEALHLKEGQLEAWTGIRERRFWDVEHTMYENAAKAAEKALQKSSVSREDIGMLIYGGVCRDNLEPATATAVADALHLPTEAHVFDLSNACLGVLNGMVQVANAIELGQIKAGLIVSCESSRQIVDMTIERLLKNKNMATLATTVATLTGGSGAVAVLLTDESLATKGHRLLGGVIRNATEHHRLCRWGPASGVPTTGHQVMDTDAVGVLKHGVELGKRTFDVFQKEFGWTAQDLDRVICHQVGSSHQAHILETLGLSPEQDFSTYPYLGNIGSVSLPMTAAIAEERGFLKEGDRVAFLGIGSGLNCLMLALSW